MSKNPLQEQQKSKVTPAQRAQMFSQMTRQHIQSDGSIEGAVNSSIKYRLDKVRLTNRVRMEIAFDLTVIHASLTTFTALPLSPYSIIRRIAVDMNNGFNPFIVSGKELYMYSLMNDYSSVLNPATSGRGKVVLPLVSSPSTGTVNKVRFLIDLPLALNDRDPVSLIVTQNQQTNVDVTIDFLDFSSIVSTAGFTGSISNIVISPVQETFSVPPVMDARPDIGILKLVQSSNQSISGARLATVKLPTGMTYRKLAFYITGADDGLGLTDSSIAGNFEIVLNQSDTPYKIKPSVLAAINHEQFRNTLPQGIWAFDFSYQGFSNFGGLRDYIDTEQLTEYWLRFNAPEACEITCVYEVLSKLQQSF